MYKRCALGLVLCWVIVSASAFVRDYQFATPVSETVWQASGDKFVCKLSHVVADYGQVTFVTRAGRRTLLDWASWQGLPSAAKGTITAVPPAWRHDVKAKRIGRYSLRAGNAILQLDAKATQNVLSALSSGYMVRLVYLIQVLGQERITVDVLPVGWQTIFVKYNQCLKQLLPYDFEDIRHMSVYFENNGEELPLPARHKLNKIAQYVKAGAKLGKIILRGYTDNTGSYNHNRRLAGRRAEAVRRFLINNGVDAKMIEIKDVFGRYRLVNKGKKGRRVSLELLH